MTRERKIEKGRQGRTEREIERERERQTNTRNTLQKPCYHMSKISINKDHMNLYILVTSSKRTIEKAAQKRVLVMLVSVFYSRDFMIFLPNLS